MTSRRKLAAAKRRMRENPRTASEVLVATIEESDEIEMTAAQAIALLWWMESQGEVTA